MNIFLKEKFEEALKQISTILYVEFYKKKG